MDRARRPTVHVDFSLKTASCDAHQPRKAQCVACTSPRSCADRGDGTLSECCGTPLRRAPRP
eukprot:1188607-Prymnesium_polylepis.1